MAARRVLLLNGITVSLAFQVLLVTGAFAIVLAEVQALTAPFIPLPEEFTDTMEGLLRVRGALEFVGAAVAICVFPAVSEEMLFRGLVLTGLLHRFGPWTAILASGTLFAAVHLNPWQFIPLLLMGIFISLIVYRTNSLYTGVLAHATNNLFSLAALNLGQRYGMETVDPRAHLPLTVVLWAVTVFFLGMAGLFLMTAGRKDSHDGF